MSSHLRFLYASERVHSSSFTAHFVRLTLFASFLLALVFLSACRQPPKAAETLPPLDGLVVENRYVIYSIGADGRNERWINRRTGLNYAASNSPCARIKQAGKEFPATSAASESGRLFLEFGDANVKAVIRVRSEETHFVWEVLSVSSTNIEEFVFVDLPLTLRGVPEEPLACTALALNLQTRVKELPQPASQLTASCFPRFGFAGARAALVGAPPAELRRVIQEVVTNAPALPKSSLGGPSAWDAAAARGSYLFDFGNLNEQTVDDWIRLVQSLGFTQIDFHGGRSFRFGDCQVNAEVFPRGRAGFKAVIDKLHDSGISAGLHTYAFFIDKKCDWVTPVPDPRLAKDKTFTLSENLTTEGNELRVNEATEGMSAVTGFFVRNSATLRVGDELITYTSVSKSAPYVFTGCKRGAYGTRAASHPRGTKADHLKECFGLFVPDPETTLLAEVAQRNADFYNECGFDMIYLDALDGEDILGGAENGWHYGSKFVFELVKRLQKPPLMEMSTFHHHLWYVRSRAGAWDHPRRAQKEFIDLHLAANEGNHRMFLPGNLGWWAVKHWSGAQEERTFADDIEYLCGKALATDSGLSLMGIEPKNAAGMARFAGIFKRYENLRHSGKVSEATKAKLREQAAEFRLVESENRGPEFRPVHLVSHRVESVDGSSTTWIVTNRFENQPLKLRIEPLMAAGQWDAETNIVLADASGCSAFTNRASAPGVSSEFVVDANTVKDGSPTLRFSATNGSASQRGAWTKIERTFTPPLNLSGREGIGLWVHGDGQGELLNIQLRSPEHVVAGIGDHYIIVDFQGWRYFELVEPESRRWAQNSWPYGDPYSIYRESVSFSQVSSLSLWLNNLPPGKGVSCHVGSIKGLPLSKTVIRQPRVAINGKTILFPIHLETGSYLEMNSATDCKVFGPNGELMKEVKPETEVSSLEPAENRLTFSCEPMALNARARVTVFCEGVPLESP